jgi:hypothetical protein
MALQIPGGRGHLALPELGQQDLVDGPFPASGTDDVLLEEGTHCLRIDRDLAHIAIEFLAAFLAVKIDDHY